MYSLIQVLLIFPLTALKSPCPVTHDFLFVENPIFHAKMYTHKGLIVL